MDRIGEAVHDLTVGRRWVEGVDVLFQGTAGDGQAVAMEQAGVEQLLEHHLHAADAIEVGHVEAAMRLHVGDVRHALADPVEVLEPELDASFVGDGE